MWHIDAEIVALLFMLTILMDISRVGVLNSLKDRLFRILSVCTILAIGADILSSAAMLQYQTTSWWWIQTTLLVYFITTPLLSLLWYFYSIAITHSNPTTAKKHMLAAFIPFCFYLFVVVSNPITNWLFSLSPTNEYARGPLFDFIFLIFYGYSLACLILALTKRKHIERTAFLILILFPIIAGAGVYLQQVLIGYLVTGAAFTLVLLITYFFLQNRKMTRDNLTGLYNRTGFSNAIEHASRSNENGFVLAIALDGFKLFNQTFGQHNGDRMLQTVGQYLVDTVPHKTCYRYGGDVFTVILRKSSAEDALHLVDTILNRFRASFHIEDTDYTISTSIGIVQYPCLTDDPNLSIITALDFAVFQAKKNGKGQYAFYDEALVRKIIRNHVISDALDRAMANHSLKVYIQPIYCITAQRFVLGEALLRLSDAELGAISPAEFIPIAEKNGKIVEITYYVLEKVCSFIQENRIFLRDEVCISVNFSAVQFMQHDVVERVSQLMAKYDTPPHLIKIEITESSLVDSLQDTNHAMVRLNDLGVQFALDDYGQGFSNISSLLELPFGYVKLDKIIVDSITDNQTVISALIPMFRALNKIIVAEGVETQAQLDLLEKLGCDCIQGFLLAKPMPMQQAADFYKMHCPTTSTDAAPAQQTNGNHHNG